MVAITPGGSSRRYWLLGKGDDATRLIGTIGTDVAENRAFIALSRQLHSQGLPVPEVLAVSDDERCYLQTFVGDKSLFDILHDQDRPIEAGKRMGLLRGAMALLAECQIKGARGMDFSVCFPQEAFDGRNIEWDLNYFKYCFLKPSGVDFSEPALQDDFDMMKGQLLTEDFGNRLMLRDYQARNVQVDNNFNLSVIDFQGARRGPMAYDVASFIWQAKAQYTAEEKAVMLKAYQERAKELDPFFDEGEFMGRYPTMVLFRILQTLGAYGFRGWLERKPHFLQSIPLAIKNLSLLLLLYPELREQYSHIAKIAEELYTKFKPKGADVIPAGELTVTVTSFSYKKGMPEDGTGNGGGFVFDCRALPNPGRYKEYSHSTGLDQDVAEFFHRPDNEPSVEAFLSGVKRLVTPSVQRYRERKFTSLQVAFGCTGGQHRSVYLAHRLAQWLGGELGVRVVEIHREQEKTFIHEGHSEVCKR